MIGCRKPFFFHKTVISKCPSVLLTVRWLSPSSRELLFPFSCCVSVHCGVVRSRLLHDWDVMAKRRVQSWSCGGRGRCLCVPCDHVIPHTHWVSPGRVCSQSLCLRSANSEHKVQDLAAPALHVQPGQNSIKQETALCLQDSRLGDGSPPVHQLSFLPPPALCTSDLRRAGANPVSNYPWKENAQPHFRSSWRVLRLSCGNFLPTADLMPLICQASQFKPDH